ncbi:glycosyltransferase [Pasteurella canis]|uniref:glycosyltransferase n=1 Tax=Pasteurella canis TaxID=753 RepID=UPI000D8AEEA7|nr:glycosyltransferase [Pasteurella canis]SPY33772.1 glycosyl transferase, family 1 protein [Pasteurella canis]
MNIVFVHKSLVFGGAESILINYLKILSTIQTFNIKLLLLENLGEKNINIDQIPSNIQIEFILNEEETKKYLYTVKKTNTKEILKKYHKLKLKYLNYIINKRIKKEISSTKINLVVNFNSHLDYFLSKYQIKKLIFRWIHGQAHLDDWENRYNWYKKILPQHQYFFAINNEMKKNAQLILKKYNIEFEKVKMLYNPIDIDFITKKSKEKSIINDKDYLISVSRLDKDKNHIQMINIYHKLKQYGIKEKLYIIGDGDYRKEIESHINMLNLNQECILLGNQINPYPLMHHAKLFLHTSLKEGLPTVLIESMACGTPVIAMDCPTGPKEILGNGKFGVLIDLNDEEAFIEKTLSLLSHPEEYKQYLNKLSEAIESFHFNKIKNTLIEYINMSN